MLAEMERIHLVQAEVRDRHFDLAGSGPHYARAFQEYGIDDRSGDVTIGGTSAAAANVISGNGDGILISDSDSSLVEGNLIGTNAAGTIKVPNLGDGVFVDA